MNDRNRGTIEMVTAMTISGTIGWFVLTSGAGVIDVVFWRCAFAALTLLVISGLFGYLRRDIMTGRQALLAAFGGVAVVLNWLMLFAAYPRASISIATAIYNTQPFMLVALGIVIFREKLTGRAAMWLAVAFIGVLVLGEAGPESSGGSDYVIGILLSLGAAFFYAVAAIVTKKLKGVPPFPIVLIQVIVGLVMLAPLADLSNPPTTFAAWGSFAVLGAVHTGLMFVLLYSAIQRLPTQLTGALSFVYPLVAILVDALAFGHRLEPVQLIGAAAILLAAASMTLGWSPFRKRRDTATGVSR